MLDSVILYWKTFVNFITFNYKFLFNKLPLLLTEMAPSKIDDGGLSEYELMRMKNMEENRRILESIRREQVRNNSFLSCFYVLFDLFLPIF